MRQQNSVRIQAVDKTLRLGCARFAAGLLLASISLGALAEAPTHDDRISVEVSKEFGVEASELQRFFRSAAVVDYRLSKNSLACVELQNRSHFLSCVSDAGRAGLTSRFFARLFQKNEKLLRGRLTADSQKTIALYNYVLDFTRQVVSLGQPATWFDPGKGEFLEFTTAQRNEFPFEDGDLVLTYGGAGTSSLIGRLSSSVYRLSHALIVRKQNGVLSTIEVLPQTGAAEFPFDFFKGETYYHMRVLRWKNLAERRAVAARASALAFGWASKKIPFDLTFSSETDDRLYCTLLGALAYARAAGVSLSTLFPDQKATSAPAFLQVARAIGTETGEKFVSPMSIVRSSGFETVGEFRDTEHLVHAWRVEAAVAETAAAYAKRETIRPNWFYRNLDLVFKIPFVDRLAVVAKARAIAGLVGLEKFSTLATLEKKIIDKSVRGESGKEAEQSLLTTDFVTMREKLRVDFKKIRAQNFESAAPQSRELSENRVTRD